MKRKLFSILLTASLLASLAACGGTSFSQTETKSNPVSTVTESTAESSAAESTHLPESKVEPEESRTPNVSSNTENAGTVDFSAFDEMDFTWPTADAWANVGLPNLPYDYEASDIWVDQEGQAVYVHRHVDLDAGTEEDAVNDYAEILAGAGITGEWGKAGAFDLYDSYMAYYDFNGIPMYVQMGKDNTASITIKVQANKTKD